MHARTVGVEDARNLDAHPVLLAIAEEQRLGTTLAFVVARPGPYGIDVAPITFRLGMNHGIAVDLAGRRLKNLCLESLAESQHVDRAVHAGLGCLHRIDLIVNRRSRTSKIVDLVDLHIERKGYVVAQKLEMRIAQKVRDIVLGSSEE